MLAYGFGASSTPESECIAELMKSNKNQLVVDMKIEDISICKYITISYESCFDLSIP